MKAQATGQQQNTPEESINTSGVARTSVCEMALSAFSSAAELARIGFWQAFLQDGHRCLRIADELPLGTGRVSLAAYTAQPSGAAGCEICIHWTSFAVTGNLGMSNANEKAQATNQHQEPNHGERYLVSGIKPLAPTLLSGMRPP